MPEIPESLQLLYSAHDEISHLRRTVKDLAPRAHAYDTIAAIARLVPKPEHGQSVDVAWRIEEAIKDMERERSEANERQQTQTQGPT